MAGFDLDGKRQVFLVGLLDHARYLDEIDLVREGKTPDDRRARQDEDIDVLAEQMGGNRQSPPDMAKAVGVMGIHEDVIRGILVHLLFRSNRMVGVNHLFPWFSRETIMPVPVTKEDEKIPPNPPLLRRDGGIESIFE